MTTILRPPSIDRDSSSLASGALRKTVPRLEDLDQWEDQLVHERSRRHKWKLWQRSPDSVGPRSILYSPPSNRVTRVRYSTAADSGVDTGQGASTTTTVSAASRDTQTSEPNTAVNDLNPPPHLFDRDPLASPQVAQHGPVSGFPVVVQLGVLDRLRELEFASSLGLRAERMAYFAPAEQQKLKNFQREFNRVRIDWFRGRVMPNVRFELVVLVKDDGSNGKRHATVTSAPRGNEGTTSICIRGLQTDGDIREFHRVMSKEFIRRLYKPLRLSYDRSIIRTAAKRTEATYAYYPSPHGMTLCGAAIHTTTTNGESFTSTIGGIVDAGGHLYAITTSHSPRDELQHSSPGSTSTSDPVNDPQLPSEYEDDVQSPLVLGLPNSDSETPSIESASPQIFPARFQPLLGSDQARSGLEGDDWRLIPLSGVHCLPNTIPSELPGGFYAPAPPKEKGYVTTYMKSPLRKRVHVLGCTGRSTGILLSSASFLSIYGGPATEVWTVVFDRPVLQRGDSGSWVVDRTGELVGMVRALSSEQAYIVPFFVLTEQIVSDAPGLGNVRLPSPLQCWLERSRAEHEISSSVARDAVRSALSPAVLAASAKRDRLARTLQAAQKKYDLSDISIAQLEDLLLSEGNALRAFLDADSSTTGDDTSVSGLHRHLKHVHLRVNSPGTSADAGRATSREKSQKPPEASQPLGTQPRSDREASPVVRGSFLWNALPLLPISFEYLVSKVVMASMSAVAGIAALVVLEAVSSPHRVGGPSRIVEPGDAGVIGMSFALPVLAFELLCIPPWETTPPGQRLDIWPSISEMSLPAIWSILRSPAIRAVLSIVVAFARPHLAVAVASKNLELFASEVSSDIFPLMSLLTQIRCGHEGIAHRRHSCSSANSAR